MANYERLSALDSSFLGLEDSSCHMHVGGVHLFEAAPLEAPSGALDIERIRAAIQARLHLVPRFRQRLTYLPIEQIPVWVDDDRFRLAYHVRHTALPKPGDERTLKRLVGRIMSQPLDRKRPLWEMWFVEGLDGDRFAMISKTHHCMIDGISGADIMSVLLDVEPNPEPGESEPWTPKPHPGEARLIADELKRRMAQPFQVVDALGDAIRDPEAALQRLEDNLAALADALSPALHAASPTPLNVEIGPHRRFDWTTMQVADFKAVKDVLGGTLNDVVLATVSGALRRFLLQRGTNPNELDVRAMVPVSVRVPGQRGQLGNRVTEMIADLPVHVEDPLARLEAVRETMGDLKESKQALGGEMLTAIADWTVPNVLVQAVRLAQRSRPYNLIVTNVPGPQIPLYFLGCPMQTTFPVVPLFRNLGVVIGLFSYNGGLFWGLNADWETVPDLHDFILHLEDSFRELQDLAAAERRRTRKPAIRKPVPRKRRTTRRRASGGKHGRLAKAKARARTKE